MVGMSDAGKQTALQQGPAKTWPIELSWQALHERLPRRVARLLKTPRQQQSLKIKLQRLPMAQADQPDPRT